MDKNNYLRIVCVFLICSNLILLYKVFKNKENMTSVDNLNKKIRTEINKIYNADIDSIRNLSKISKDLQNGGLSIPGDLKVTGKIIANDKIIANEDIISKKNIRSFGHRVIKKYKFNDSHREFRDREFYISEPHHFDQSKKYPIVLLFHGGGEVPFDRKGKGILNYTKFHNTECFCIVPQGQKSNNKHSWSNAFPWLKNEPKNDVKFIEYIIKILKTSKNRNNIDFDRIYASGKSDGAGFCLFLHEHATDIKLKKIGICSGAHFNIDNNNKYESNPIPILAIHGTGDKVMPYNGQHFRNRKAIRDAEYWYTKDSTLENTYTAHIKNYFTEIANINGSVEMKRIDHPKYHRHKHYIEYIFRNSDHKDVLIHIKINGQNHCWSGHRDSGPDSDKLENHYFDATEKICKFFDIEYLKD